MIAFNLEIHVLPLQLVLLLRVYVELFAVVAMVTMCYSYR